MSDMCTSSTLGQLRIDTDGHAATRDISFDGDASIALSTFVIIERRTLLRDCLARSIRSKATHVVSFPSVPDLIANAGGRRAALVVLSIENLSKQEIQRDLSSLRSIAPSTPVAIVAERGDLNDALDAIKMGAKGYISTSMGLDVALEAMQFVSAGGTYLPVECVLAAKQSSGKAAAGDSAGALTSRELAVIQAIRHGRSNKMIAYQLNMCESTVKVHVRHIMKKLRARNRTEVAIRAAEIVNFCD